MVFQETLRGEKGRLQAENQRGECEEKRGDGWKGGNEKDEMTVLVYEHPIRKAMVLFMALGLIHGFFLRKRRVAKN